MTRPRGFSDLLAPVDTARFLRDHWEQEPLLVHGRAPEHYAGILTVEDLDRFLQSSRLPSGLVKAVRDGEHPPGVDSATQQAGGAFVDQVQLFAAFAEGATLIVEGAHRVPIMPSDPCDDSASDWSPSCGFASRPTST